MSKMTFIEEKEKEPLKEIVCDYDNLPGILRGMRKDIKGHVGKIGKQVGYTMTSIYDWESGRARPSYPALLDMLNFYGYELIIRKRED